MLFVAFLILFLQGCTHNIQTTSGGDYLKKYDTVQSAAKESAHQNDAASLSMQEKIRQTAAVEPILTFPARIGLARIENGSLTAVPGGEIEAWDKAKQKLGRNFGEFVPVSPLIAHMVGGGQSSGNYQDRIGNITNKIRLGAARQHLDAVLIYEVYSKSDRDSNFLSIADLTIIGAYILPSKELEVEGFASALLIDVLQGYPYGTIETTVTKEGFASTFGAGDMTREIADQVTTQAVHQLVDESVQMFTNLRVELAEKRADRN